jgi:hypothetical protein
MPLFLEMRVSRVDNKQLARIRFKSPQRTVGDQLEVGRLTLMSSVWCSTTILQISLSAIRIGCDRLPWMSCNVELAMISFTYFTKMMAQLLVSVERWRSTSNNEGTV